MIEPSIIDKACERYATGESLRSVCEDMALSNATLWRHLKKRGLNRSSAEAVQLAAREGRMGSGWRGKKRTFSRDHCENISRARVRWADAGNAIGVSLKPNGYMAFTRGENAGRLVHTVKMEERLGRRLKPDECVHHIDGDRTNNQDNNLALLTRSGHSRLHRREESLSGKINERDANGRFTK